MNIIDLHCDTIMRLYQGEHLSEMEDRHINMRKLLEGGVMAQAFAVFTPTGEGAKRWNIPAPGEYFDLAVAALQREIRLNEDKLAQARSVSEIEANAAAGKVSALLTVEDAVSLEGKTERIDYFYDQGVRIIGITWNHENELGFPNSPDPEQHAKGLKPFGFEALERMNELGILADVSHLSEGGFWDIAKHTKTPFTATHSCARALCDHPRNLTDDQIRAVADKGGIIGVNFYGLFLHPMAEGEACTASCEDIARHLEHMKNVGGIDVLALGSDYDGMHTEMEWGDCGGNQKLLAALEKSFTSGEIDKISHGNALRVFREVIG